MEKTPKRTYKDKDELKRHAEILVGRTLYELYPESDDNPLAGKGRLGQLVEVFHFDLKLNNTPEPDFKALGIELKTTPLKKANRKGLVSKERLVLNKIDYFKEIEKVFKESGFYKKNNCLLLLFYVYQKGIKVVEYEFDHAAIWEFPEKDLKIIEDDWNKIVGKIRQGKAHELSESDTIYLSACTKGADSSQLTTQPNSDHKAKPRAFSLKSRYVTYMYRTTKGKAGSIESDTESILDRKTLSDKTLTFEESVVARFERYIGMSEKEIIKLLNIEIDPEAKNRYEILAKRMMGVTKKKVEEFEKGGVIMKTIRVGDGGRIEESMSFRQIQYMEIVNEDWEDSVWYGELTRRFFLVLFKKYGDEYRLERVAFWGVPVNDLDVLKQVWTDTRDKVMSSDFRNMMKERDRKLGHVRPKGRNAKDLMTAPDGRGYGKTCFWLNRSYIKSVVEGILDGAEKQDSR